MDGPNTYELLAKQVVNLSPPKEAKASVENAAKTTKEKTPLKSSKPSSWPSQPPSSEFHSEVVISSCRQNYISMLWINLRDKISRTPLDHMFSIKNEAAKILDEMNHGNHMNISALESLECIL